MSDDLGHIEHEVRQRAIEADGYVEELFNKHHVWYGTKDAQSAHKLRLWSESRAAFCDHFICSIKPEINRARLVLAGAIKAMPKPKQTSKDIIRIVAGKHGVRVCDIRSHMRTPTFIKARFEACYEIRRLLPHYSLPMIGKAVGGRDHTTILHAIQQHAIRNGLPRLDGGR